MRCSICDRRMTEDEVNNYEIMCQICFDEPYLESRDDEDVLNPDDLDWDLLLDDFGVEEDETFLDFPEGTSWET